MKKKMDDRKREKGMEENVLSFSSTITMILAAL